MLQGIRNNIVYNSKLQYHYINQHRETVTVGKALVVAVSLRTLLFQKSDSSLIVLCIVELGNSSLLFMLSASCVIASTWCRDKDVIQIYDFSRIFFDV